MSDLSRAVVVTGATSDIGAAICLRFAEQGFHVIAQARDAVRGQAVVDRLTKAGHSAELVVADLTATAGIDRVVQTVAAAQVTGLTLVNNAGGVCGEQPFDPLVVADPSPAFTINLFAPYRLTMGLVPYLPGGSVANISSINALSARMGAVIPLYSASKAALTHLSAMLAIKLAPQDMAYQIKFSRAALRNLDTIPPGMPSLLSNLSPDPRRESTLTAPGGPSF